MIVHYVVRSTQLGHWYACEKHSLPVFFRPKELPANIFPDENKECFTPIFELATCTDCIANKSSQ